MTTNETTKTDANDKTDPNEKLRELIKGIDDAMLVTADRHGHPRARPMRIVAFDEGSRDDLWFISRLDCEKIEEIRAEPRVCVSMSDSTRFISMTGHAQVVLDKRKLVELWQDEWKIWMPDGPSSNSIALIQVRPLYVEYWDQSMATRARFALEAAKAWWNAESIDPPEGPEYHATVNYG